MEGSVEASFIFIYVNEQQQELNQRAGMEKTDDSEALPYRGREIHQDSEPALDSRDPPTTPALARLPPSLFSIYAQTL